MNIKNVKIDSSSSLGLTLISKIISFQSFSRVTRTRHIWIRRIEMARARPQDG